MKLLTGLIALTILAVSCGSESFEEASEKAFASQLQFIHAPTGQCWDLPDPDWNMQFPADALIPSEDIDAAKQGDSECVIHEFWPLIHRDQDVAVRVANDLGWSVALCHWNQGKACPDGFHYRADRVTFIVKDGKIANFRGGLADRHFERPEKFSGWPINGAELPWTGCPYKDREVFNSVFQSSDSPDSPTCQQAPTVCTTFGMSILVDEEWFDCEGDPDPPPTTSTTTTTTYFLGVVEMPTIPTTTVGELIIVGPDDAVVELYPDNSDADTSPIESRVEPTPGETAITGVCDLSVHDNCDGPWPTSTTTTTSTIPPTDTLVEYVDTPRELVRIPVDVTCGVDGPEAEFLIDGEPVESELQRWVDFGLLTYPSPAGWPPPEVGPIAYEYVLGAYDTEDTDYVFEGGLWIVDSTDPENITCEQYQGPEWTKYANRDVSIGEKKLIEWVGIATEESEGTESGFKQEADIELREPHSCQEPEFWPFLKEGQECFVVFDYVVEATTDGKLLQMGFDCASDGIGSQWSFIDGVLEGATYYHPPEIGEADYQQFLVEPSRDLYGPSSYLPTVFVEQQDDGSTHVFDAGLSRTDWNLTATTAFDLLDWESDYDGEIYSLPNWNNCTLVDW